MKSMRKTLVETRDRIKGESNLATQVEGVGQMVNICVDALQEEMDGCRSDGVSEISLSRIHELRTMTMEVETVYIEYTSIVQEV